MNDATAPQKQPEAPAPQPRRRKAPEAAQPPQNRFVELAAVDVGKHIERKGKFSYLSWAWAVDQLLRRDPSANWSYGQVHTFADGTMMVNCTVVAFGQPRTMQLPVMNSSNKAIVNPGAFEVNTALQRCLVKAIALHGLGLYIYAGEDVRREEPVEVDQHQQEQQDAALQALRDAALDGMESLKSLWKTLPEALREALKGELSALKDAAIAADHRGGEAPDIGYGS